MRELIEKCIQIHESTVPSWVKKAARSRTVEGPNGNKAIAYDWRWMWEEVWSKREDGLVSKKVSDFDNAMNCTTCGRRIVHVYWVETKDGEILPYGGDHLHTILGYPRELQKSQLLKIRAKVTTLKKTQDEDKELKKRYALHIAARSAPGIVPSNKAFLFSGGQRRESGPIFLLNKKDNAVMRGDDLIIDRFTSYYPDWKVEDPEKIRAFLEKHSPAGR